MVEVAPLTTKKTVNEEYDAVEGTRSTVCIITHCRTLKKTGAAQLSEPQMLIEVAKQCKNRPTWRI
jgi:hypothetical protein